MIRRTSITNDTVKGMKNKPCRTHQQESNEENNQHGITIFLLLLWVSHTLGLHHDHLLLIKIRLL